MVAFRVVKVARLVVDCLKGAHTAASKGVAQKILAENCSCGSLGSIWGSLTRAEDTRKKKKEKGHFEQLRILCTLTVAYTVAAFKIRQIKSFNSYQRTNRNQSDKIMIIVNARALHFFFSSYIFSKLYCQICPLVIFLYIFTAFSRLPTHSN